MEDGEVVSGHREDSVFPPEGQLLQAHRPPRPPDRYLVEGSCGIPFYCEELLRNLDRHRVLDFQPVESEEKANVTWKNLFSECPLLSPLSGSGGGRRAFPWAASRRGQRARGVRGCGA